MQRITPLFLALNSTSVQRTIAFYVKLTLVHDNSICIGHLPWMMLG